MPLAAADFIGCGALPDLIAFMISLLMAFSLSAN
jgi:hypothetical protein